MFCSNCGTPLPDEAKFCSNCGKKLEGPSQARTQQEELSHRESICPICKRNDQVQKISAIVEHDTKTISGTSQTWVSQEKGGFWATTPISGTQVSDLARKLSAPVKPQVKNFSCLILGIGLLFLGSGIMESLYAILSIVDGIESEIVDAVPAALILLAIGIMILRARKTHDEKERQRVADERPQWEKAINIWNRLYYCFRDDIVFDPTTQKTAFPQEINKFYISINVSNQAKKPNIQQVDISINQNSEVQITKAEFSKLTYRQKFAVTEYGYLLSPDDAEIVGKMFGNFQEKSIPAFCESNGKKVSSFEQ